MRMMSRKEDEILAAGIGALRDVSAGGFRVENPRWLTPVGPVRNSSFSFEIVPWLDREKVEGTGCLAWVNDGGAEGVRSLGVSILRFEDVLDERRWVSAVAGEGSQGRRR